MMKSLSKYSGYPKEKIAKQIKATASTLVRASLMYVRSNTAYIPKNLNTCALNDNWLDSETDLRQAIHQAFTTSKLSESIVFGCSFSIATTVSLLIPMRVAISFWVNPASLRKLLNSLPEKFAISLLH